MSASFLDRGMELALGGVRDLVQIEIDKIKCVDQRTDYHRVELAAYYKVLHYCDLVEKAGTED